MKILPCRITAVRSVAMLALAGVLLTRCAPSESNGVTTATSSSGGGNGTAGNGGASTASGGTGAGTASVSTAGTTTGGNAGAIGAQGGSAGLGFNPGGGANCLQQGLEFTSLTPTVELLVDRSVSMTADFGGKDRWNTIRDILIAPAEGFVALMQSKVRFGLSLYTGLSIEDPGGPSCVDLIQVPPMLNNYQAIHDVFAGTEVGNQTPTAESLSAITADLEEFTEIGPKFIVLATDGDPDTCLDPDSNGTAPPRLMAEEAVQVAWAKGITTYVIAVGDDIQDLNHMQTLASLGRGGEPSAQYYPATDANSLVSAFASIFSTLVSCEFTLNGTVDAVNANRGTVTVGDVPLTYGDPNGWDMPTTSTLRLLGAACDQVRLSPVPIDIQFPCGTFMIQ